MTTPPLVAPSEAVDHFTPPSADELANLDRIMEGEATCNGANCDLPAVTAVAHPKPCTWWLQCQKHTRILEAWIASGPHAMAECVECDARNFPRGDITVRPI